MAQSQNPPIEAIKCLRIFHLFAENPLEQIYTKFCMRGHLADVITHAKFYLNRIKGLDSVGVEFSEFIIGSWYAV